MTPAEYYAAIRAEDQALSEIEGSALHKVRTWTGYDPTNVGSFGLLLNLPGSDLDISIGIEPENLEAVRSEVEHKRCTYVATRQTRPGTVRHVYRFEEAGVEVDLALMHRSDLDALRPGLSACRRGMSEKERVAHVWEKQRLRRAQDPSYATFKLAPYMQYCPGFSWLPLPDS